jgi:hypothetical protein
VTAQPSRYKTDAYREKSRLANEKLRRARGVRPISEYRAAMKPHGTIAAYQREDTWSEPHCDDCRLAHTLYRRDRDTYRAYEALVLTGTAPPAARAAVGATFCPLKKAAVKKAPAKRRGPTPDVVLTDEPTRQTKAAVKKPAPASDKASVRDAQAAAFIAGQGKKKPTKKGTPS